MLKKLDLIGVIVAVTLIAGCYGSIVSVKATAAVQTAATAVVTPTPLPGLTDPLKKLMSCLNYNPNFGPERLSPEIPEDAYNTGGPKCANAKPPKNDAELALFQRDYDMFSWQSLLAINWPVDAHGKALESITAGPGVPLWTTWKEGYEVFRQDGSAPADWGAPRTLPTFPDCCPLPTGADLTDKTIRILSETEQVSSGLPLWDQNGNMVYYEVLLNDEEFEFIKEHELYNIDGQIAYASKSGVLLSLPLGIYGKSNIGSIELKLAWKILADSDIPDRFFTMNAYVLDSNKEQWLEQKVGLVGMHIAHKTFSAQNWVWSTFEHVDNVAVNDLEVIEYAKQGQTLKPSFNDPHCPICPVNVKPTPDANGLTKTQVTRVVPIPEATTELNNQVQNLLKQQGSVWQYYELINTQFPTDQTAPLASADQELPDLLTNKSGGYPHPVYLVNAVIETYDQKGNQEASDLVQGPLNDAKEIVFGTQSCMGCHSVAGIAGIASKETGQNPTYVTGAADFSWLMQTRAQWKK